MIMNLAPHIPAVLSLLVMLFALLVWNAAGKKREQTARPGRSNSFDLEMARSRLHVASEKLSVPLYQPAATESGTGARGATAAAPTGDGLSFASATLSQTELMQLIDRFERLIVSWENETEMRNIAYDRLQDLRRCSADLKGARDLHAVRSVQESADAYVGDIVEAVVREADQTLKQYLKPNSERERILARIVELAGLSLFSPKIGSSFSPRDHHSVSTVGGGNLRSGVIGKVKVRGLERNGVVRTKAIVALTK